MRRWPRNSVRRRDRGDRTAAATCTVRRRLRRVTCCHSICRPARRTVGCGTAATGADLWPSACVAALWCADPTHVRRAADMRSGASVEANPYPTGCRRPPSRRCVCDQLLDAMRPPARTRGKSLSSSKPSPQGGYSPPLRGTRVVAIAKSSNSIARSSACACLAAIAHPRQRSPVQLPLAATAP